MKKSILSLLAIGCTLLSSANPINKQAALFTAQSYLLAKGKTLAPDQTSTRKRSSASIGGGAEEGQPYYYVFNAGNDGGYVIVSGDDRTEPVLGYVEQGTFDPDNIPENMRSWLQLYADQIKFIVDNDIDPNSPLLKKRNKVRGTKHSVPELLTTRWNQGHPYNLTCPHYYTDKDNDEHEYPATGCTATAMAQVMYFYRYPEKTKAIIPAHSNTYTLKNGSTKTVTVRAVPRNTPIDWENMRDTYNCNDSHVHDRADTAVANLMLYCGQSVHMGWGPSSGANFSAEAYHKYFGYDNSCYVGERYDYSIDDWFDMLYNEIEQGYPVLFSGFSSGGGHAFVLDGFDGDNLFHLNWGWGGGSNGWFLVGILNPGDTSGIGASSSSDGYSMSQRALFNLRLPDNNSADTYLFIKDVSVSSTSIKATFENRTGATGSFNTAIVKQDDDGALSVVGNQLTISGMNNNDAQTKTFSINGKLPEGTYKLSPASKPVRSTVWRPKYNLRNHYIEAMVDGEGNVTLTPIDINNGNSISIDTIVFPGTRIVGQEQEVKVTYRNNGDEYFKEVRLFASKTSNKIYTESRSIVAVRKGETVEVSYFFTPDETGTYNLWFCTGSNGSGEVGTGTVEIIEASQAVKANLSVSSYTISNAVSGVVYGNQIIGKASIKNNAKTEFNGPIRLQIWNQPNSSGSAWGGSSHTYEVNILAGKIAVIDFEFDDVKENNKYYISASFVNHTGTFSNAGVWDLGGWEVKTGVAQWKNDGILTGRAYASSIPTATNICGVYADCSKKITRMTPNRNPNTIYAFSQNMVVPANLDTSSVANVVSGAHSRRINLYNSNPYYNPVNFTADSASFTFTFPEIEAGTGWHAFTMPFEADSVFVDDIPVMLDDTLKHFWIYEFAAQGDNGEVIFAPATVLRGNTPYIIAGDTTMAGRSIVFRSLDVPFYKTTLGKMVITSTDYKFHGNTCAPTKMKDIYALNGDGTAFEYVTTSTNLTALVPYFTTSLPEELRLPSIVLPEIPKSALHNLVLDETESAPVVAGTYDRLILKRTFEAGMNTICLPFAVDDVAAAFGQDAKAYEFFSYEDKELNFVKVDALAAGQPYIIILPEAITEDIVLKNIVIDEANIHAGCVFSKENYFWGTYAPIGVEERTKDTYFGVTADGKLAAIGFDGDDILGFRAWFFLSEEAQQAMMETPESITLRFHDTPSGIKALEDSQATMRDVFNLAGQRLSKPVKGINIVGVKKILVK